MRQKPLGRLQCVQRKQRPYGGVLAASITSVFDALGYGPLVVRGRRPADEVERILPEPGEDWLFSPNFVALRFARIDR